MYSLTVRGTGLLNRDIDLVKTCTSAAGQTDAGRYLVVFFVYKADNTALVLSARDMDRRERRQYERK